MFCSDDFAESKWTHVVITNRTNEWNVSFWQLEFYRIHYICWLHWILLLGCRWFFFLFFSSTFSGSCCFSLALCSFHFDQVFFWYICHESPKKSPILSLIASICEISFASDLCSSFYSSLLLSSFIRMFYHSYCVFVRVLHQCRAFNEIQKLILLFCQYSCINIHCKYVLWVSLCECLCTISTNWWWAAWYNDFLLNIQAQQPFHFISCVYENCVYEQWLNWFRFILVGCILSNRTWHLFSLAFVDCAQANSLVKRLYRLAEKSCDSMAIESLQFSIEPDIGNNVEGC